MAGYFGVAEAALETLAGAIKVMLVVGTAAAVTGICWAGAVDGMAGWF